LITIAPIKGRVRDSARWFKLTRRGWIDTPLTLSHNQRSPCIITEKKYMSDTTPPRNVIYFSSNANQIPLTGIGTLPYTDVIIGFLVPNANLDLQGAGGAFNGNLQSNIQTLQNAGKNVLISVGGGKGFSSSDYQSYAQNVNKLVTR
jgi:hypothetical protein